jgi:hypothetical protein
MPKSIAEARQLEAALDQFSQIASDLKKVADLTTAKPRIVQKFRQTSARTQSLCEANTQPPTPNLPAAPPNRRDEGV